ncbi:oligosaccharide flippase family protein [Coraliomargarita sp. W4R53]
MSIEVNKKAMLGARWAAASSVGQGILGGVTIFALMKFLGVEEYGKVALVSVVAMFSRAIGDMGLSQSVIKEKTLSRLDINTVFLTNVMSGALFALVLVLLSHWISKVFASPDLEPLLHLTALAIFINSATFLYKAMLQKELKFATLEKIAISCVTVSSIVKIGLAVIGLDAISFVYGIIIQSLLEFVILYLVFRRDSAFDFHLSYSFSTLRRLSKFGIFVSLKSLLNQAGKDLDSIVIAKLLGFEALGIYNFGKELVQKFVGLFSSVMVKVLFPYFSALRSSAGKDELSSRLEMKNIYMTLVGNICLFATPFFVFLAVSRPERLSTLLGSELDGVGAILSIFAIKAIFEIVSGGVFSAVLYSLDKASLLFYVDLFVTPLRVVLYVIGAWFYSINGVAYMFLFSVIIKVVILQYFIKKELNISGSQIVWVFCRGLYPAVISGCVCAAFSQSVFIGSFDPAYQFGLAVVIFFSVVFFLSLLAQPNLILVFKRFVRS